MRYLLQGLVSSVHADMLDTSDWSGPGMVTGRTFIGISWPGGGSSFACDIPDQPKLGTPVIVTVEVGE
jgi:hypothetical protein